MRRVLEILTPENVKLEYELAGLGSRFGAFVIDCAIQVVLTILVVVAVLISGMNFQDIQKINSGIIAVGIILFFIIWFGYHIFFEMITNGQTPGKKVFKLRVIKHNGEPEGIFESIVRNLLRLADFLPSFYLAGAAFIIFNRYYKRIGDLSAGTIVVKVVKQHSLIISDFVNAGTLAQDEEMKMVNTYPVNNVEYSVLKEYLARRETLGGRKPVFEYHLNKYFMKKFGIDRHETGMQAEDFLFDIIKTNS